MDTKISGRFWSDREIEDCDRTTKFIALWLLTNPRVMLCGFTEISVKRFSFETDCTEEDLRRAIEALPNTFLWIGKGVWAKQFIAYQFGDGETLEKNNIARSLVRELERDGDPALIEAVYSEYPVLKKVKKLALNKPSATPPRGEREREGVEKEQATEQGSPEGENRATSQGSLQDTPQNFREKKTGGAEGGDLQAAMKAVCKIAGRTRLHFSYSAQEALGRYAPLPPEEVETVAWFYSLPDDDNVPELRPGMRKRDADKLAIDWPQEADRARNYAKKTGREKNGAKKNGAPVGWPKWLATAYPNATRPTKFEDLPGDLQRECAAALAQSNETSSPTAADGCGRAEDKR